MIKFRTTIDFSDDALEKLSAIQKLNDLESRNLAIEKAINFYFNYLLTQDPNKFITQSINEMKKDIIDSVLLTITDTITEPLKSLNKKLKMKNTDETIAELYERMKKERKQNEERTNIYSNT